MRSVASNLINLPIVLRGTATIPANAGTTTPVTLDTTRLQNTLRVPIEITELLVTVRAARWIDGVSVLNERVGAGVELDLRVGGRHLTNGFVPFQVLAPWDFLEDGVWNEGNIQGESTLAIGFNQRRVVLPAPIRLRPGVGFSGAARRNVPAGVTAVPTAAELVSVVAIGRAVPAGILSMTTQQLPLWISATLIATPSVPIVSTTERDLFNPLAVPLDVAQIITATGEFAATRMYCPAPELTELDPVLTLRWPNGDFLSESPSFYQASIIREHSIVDRFQLPPGSRINAEINATNAFGQIGDSAYAQIAVFGTRREVL